MKKSKGGGKTCYQVLEEIKNSPEYNLVPPEEWGRKFRSQNEFGRTYNYG